MKMKGFERSEKERTEIPNSLASLLNPSTLCASASSRTLPIITNLTLAPSPPAFHVGLSSNSSRRARSWARWSFSGLLREEG